MPTDADPAASGTLVPAAGLVRPDPQDPNAPPLFALFTDDWLTMQTFIAAALQLPITTGDFVTKYGEFQDEQDIENCLKAMADVKNLSAEFGDPLALLKAIADDPTVLQGDTAPQPIYTHIVWFADRLYQGATSYNQTLAQFEELLKPANCGSPSECADVLKEVLTGNGGLQSTAQAMLKSANDLTQALAAFAVKLKPSTDVMSEYTDSASGFYADVQKAIEADTADITTYQNAADDAYKLWRDLTISAITTSVGTLVLSGGMAWPLSAALAGGLGDAAKKARDAYNDAIAQRDAASADDQKKIDLKADLDGFNKQMAPVNEAVVNFQADLQKVTAAWSAISGNLDYIAKNFTPEQLGSLSWVMQSLDCEKATKDWQAIADAAKQYTQGSLVTYKIHPFGAPLPAG